MFQSLLHDAPSDEMTAMGFRETLTSHCVLQGNAYAQIIRRSGALARRWNFSPCSRVRFAPAGKTGQSQLV